MTLDISTPAMNLARSKPRIRIGVAPIIPLPRIKKLPA
jgi:hypothetical protein